MNQIDSQFGRLRREVSRLIRFGLVGLVSNATLLLVFLGFVRVGMRPWVASGIVYGIGLVANYFLHRRWTFNSVSRHRHDSVSFLLAYGVGLVVSMGLVFSLATEIGPLAAQISAAILAAGVIYGVLLLTKFGRASSPQAEAPGRDDSVSGKEPQ